jgi:hypothetical protein
VGERVERFGKRASFDIVCECDRESCNGRLIVTVSEYEHVRSDPVLFFVSPGHEDRRIEQVVRETARYFVVRKIGEAAEIARKDSER